MLKIIKLALDELVNGTINDTLNGVLNENEKAILRVLKKNPKLTQKELSIKFNLSLRTINRILKNLNEKAYLKRMGSKKVDIMKCLGMSKLCYNCWLKNFKWNLWRLK